MYISAGVQHQHSVRGLIKGYAPIAPYGRGTGEGSYGKFPTLYHLGQTAMRPDWFTPTILQVGCDNPIIPHRGTGYHL